MDSKSTTTKAAHTPGPWEVRCARIFGAKNRPVADVLQWAMDQDAPSAYQSKANARLIAAAPEMLETLGRIADTAYVTEENAVMCRNCRFRTEIGHGHIHAASCSIATVEAAIQKARGGQ